MHKVLKIISPVEYVIDFNNNGIGDENEIVKLIGIESFESKIFTKKSLYYKKHLTIEDVVENYYLSMNFLNKYLLNKNVDVEILSEGEIKFSKVYFNGKDVGETLLLNGYGVVKPDTYNFQHYLEFENIVKIKENSKKCNEFDFVVLNKTNNVYHEKNCRHIHNFNKYEIIARKDILPTYKPCHYCHILKTKKTEQPKSEKIFLPLKFNKFEFYVLNFLNQQKPEQNCKSFACKRLLDLINNAKSSIDIAIYDFHNQPLIFDALKNAQKRGVNVRIVTDCKNFKNNSANYQKILQELKSIKYDEKSKKSSRTIMHNKFVIFDNKTVYTGSANFTNTDLSGFNANIVIVAENNLFAQYYKKEFEQMWQGNFSIKKNSFSKQRIFINKKDYAEIYFSPTDKAMTERIIPLIQSAKKSIYITCFIITHKKLKEELLKATKRGVEIKIITDATSAGNKHTVNAELRKNGIKVKVENLAGKMHMKSVIIDEQKVVTGSMNFSRNGEDFNDENIIIIDSAKLAKYYKEYFFAVWNFIPDKWLHKNPPAESFASLGSCFDGIDNDYDEKIDSEDEGCKKTK